MGPSGLVCPLCCGEEFPCRASLRRHIAEASYNLRCPACQRTVRSLSELIQHLEMEQCSDLSRFTNDNEEHEAPVLEEADEMADIPVTLVDEKHELKSLLKIEPTQLQDPPNQLASTTDGHNSLNVIEDSESHLLIVGGESGSLLDNQNIITTQNEDGTISFTPVEPEDMECAEEERLSPGEEDMEGEVYSCNTCGVSFTSVLQHIQRYHSEQDVVVEVAGAEGEAPEEVQVGVGGGKRIITTTGDIVETHTHANTQREGEGPSDLMEEEVVDKSGRAYTRRLIKIDKFWNDDQFVVGAPSKVKETLEFNAEDGHSVRIFSCRRCNMKSSEIEDLRSHNCKPAGVYQCSQCPVTYTNPKSLCAHMKVHKIGTTKLTAQLDVFETKTETELMSFKCLVCDTVFPSNKSLRLHRRMHEPVKSRPMEGPVEYSSVDQGSGEGDSGDTYHCEVCDKWIHVGYREIHNNYHHSSVQYHCEICNRKFLSQDYLMMHMNVHSTEKTSVAKSDKVLPYSCLYCKRQFARPHEKVKHERIHTGEKPHTCEICGKAFRVSYCLTLHMRTHTGARPYECQHCGKRFKAHSVYNHHLLTHSEVRAYKCPYCPKAFKTSVQLAGHKNSHTKPFACTHCNRPFASLYAVRVHTETHRRQNNLKFSCKLCGASYARAFALKDHVKSAHDTVPDSVEYNSPEAAYEADPALAIMPKKEDNFEVEELAHSSIESEVAMM